MASADFNSTLGCPGCALIVSGDGECPPACLDPECPRFGVALIPWNGVRFFPGERLHCPAQIRRGNGSKPCRRPIEIDLPSRTRAEIRVVAIPHFRAGEVLVTCKRRSCRAQLAIQFEGVE